MQNIITCLGFDDQAAATFLLDRQELMALNGGPSFTFSIGMSILIKCDTQAEIDHLWEQLSEGGKKVRAYEHA